LQPDSNKIKSHRHAILKVDGLVVSGHAGFLEGLGEGWVSMAGARDVLAAGAVLHRQHALGNHLTGVGADDVHAKDLVGLLVRQHLHQAYVRARKREKWCKANIGSCKNMTTAQGK